MWKAFLDTLPRGYALEEQDWRRRHRVPLRLLAAHIPALALVGGLLGRSILALVTAVAVPVVCVWLGHVLRHHRRAAAVSVTLGLVWCSAALVGLTGGAIESHFHFFIIIGFIALYQDWIPFLLMILFTTISHVVGSTWQRDLIFNHMSAQANPWLWSLIHGVAVLAACTGIVLFWHVTEDVQEKSVLARRLADAEAGKRKFTSDMLVNLARRNQSLLYRQLEIINQLEDSEHDPDTLAELFTLDHLATRVRRNAESLLVLSGEQPPRTWSKPVPMRDVLRAAIAETEDLDRVVFVADEQLAVAGHTVTDLTHLIAELTENAVRFSPPETTVSIRARPSWQQPGGQLLTVEDWGVGMPPPQLAAANALLAKPPEVDLAVSPRLGFHVVARLAARHGITVSLSSTPGSGITAMIMMPASLFATDGDEPAVQPGTETRSATGSTRVNGRSSALAAEAAPGSVPTSGTSGRAPGSDTGSTPARAVLGATAGGPVVSAESPLTISLPAVRLPAVESPAGPIVAQPNGQPAHRRNGATRNGTHPADVEPADRTGYELPLPFSGTGPVERLMATNPTAAPAEPTAQHPDGRWPGWWAAEVEPAEPDLSGPGATAVLASTPDGWSGAPAVTFDSALPAPAFEPVRPDPAAESPAADVPGHDPSRPEPAQLVPTPRPRTVAPADDATATQSIPALPPQADRRGSGPSRATDIPVDPVSGLRRRVPQAHLAPELRQEMPEPEPVAAVLPDRTAEAADALSRYQASRQAARTSSENEFGWLS
jgi:signal transduction histidine kinase